jgi:hypothetical protein
MNLPRTAFGKTTLWIIALPVVLLLLTGLTGNAEARQRNNLAYASVATLKSDIGNTHGFRVDNMVVTDAGAACIRFHTRDGATINRAQAVVFGNHIAHSDARDGRFEKEWNRQCLGLAHDVTSAVDHFF